MVDSFPKLKIIELLNKAKVMETQLEQFRTLRQTIKYINEDDVSLYLTVGICGNPTPFIAIPLNRYEELLDLEEKKK